MMFIGILLLFQGALYFVWNTSSNIVSKQYQEIQAYVNDMTLEDAQVYLQTELERSQSYRTMDPTTLNALEDKEKFYDVETLQRILKEIQHLKEYPQYYHDIVENKNTTVSIFKDKDQFSKELRKVIRSHYEGKQLSAGTDSLGSYGVEQLLNYPLIDVMVFLLIVYFIYLQVDKEREIGSYAYLRTMRKGDYRTYLSKYCSIVLSVFAFLMISYGLLFLMSGYQYGFMTLSSPIQSIPYCGSVSFAMNVAAFLLVALLMRCFLFAVLILFLYALTCITGKTIIGTSTVLLVLLIGNTLAFVNADHNSIFTFFAITNLLHPEKQFIAVRYYDLFGHAVYFLNLYHVQILLEAFVFYLGYQGYKKGNYKSFKLTREFKDKKYHSLSFYEIRKTWITGFGILVSAAFLMFAANKVVSVKTLSYSNDKIIAYYIDQFGKSPTEETYRSIEQEKVRFSAIHEKLETTKEDVERQKLLDQLFNEQAFEQYCARMDNLEDDETRAVLKEDQTRFFFENEECYAELLLYFFFLLVLLSMHSYGKEQQSGVLLYQRITRIGNRQLFLKKMGAIYSLLALTWCLINGVIVLQNHRIYPKVSWNSAIQDLQNIVPFPIDISILCYLCLQWLIQLGIIWMLTYSILYLFSKTKYNKQAAILLILCLILPMIFLLLHIQERPYLLCLFYPFMNIERFAVSFIIVLLVFLFCLYQRKRNF